MLCQNYKHLLELPLRAAVLAVLGRACGRLVDDYLAAPEVVGVKASSGIDSVDIVVDFRRSRPHASRTRR